MSDKAAAQKPETQQLELIQKNIAEISLLVQKALSRSIRREWFIGRAGETVTLPTIKPVTLYVDNTANGNPMTVKLDGDLGVWTVPANSSRYIPCEGNTTAEFSGTGQCNVLAVNRNLFFGN